ncbi:MAG: EAL domain-containing protein [Acidimicrobiia bacterium]|nr:EAL domain-containing protein [Acidimicrobiia bacterium]
MESTGTADPEGGGTVAAGTDGPEARILVVDDDPAVLRLLERALTRRGFEVLTAADGASAGAVLDDALVDVVLLDTVLPDMSGLEILRRLRETPRTATLPVIMVTGRSEPADRVDGLGAGADDYVVKPVDLDELVARVRAQLRGRDAWRSQVADLLHERAVLAGALAAVPRDEQPEQAAAQVADLLTELPGVQGVVVVDLDGEHHRALLAHAAADTSTAGPGLDLAPSLVAEVAQALGTRGDDLLHDVTSLGRSTTASLFGDDVGDAYVAPVLDDHDAVIAAVVVNASAEDHGPRGAVRAAVLDLLPVIDQTLGRALQRGRLSGSAAASLRKVIAEEAFFPVFQPIVTLDGLHTVGFEALTRFTDGTPPDRRFAEAAAAGLGADFELATLTAAARTAVDLPGDSYLSVNVSAALLGDRGMRELLAGFTSRPLVVELTEHERIDDYDGVRQALVSLGDHVRTSVDDAGSGWASLRHVFSLQPDFVKLDREWVRGIHEDPARQALLMGINSYAEVSGAAVVAEGVEVTEEHDVLRSLGIPFGQGYLFGRPVPCDEVGFA